jgi:TPR repeat protein
MVLLGSLILQKPTPPANYGEAVELFRRAAAQGNVDAEYNLGVCLRRGLGVTADTEAAERCYRIAAQRSHVSAQLALADLIAASAANDAQWLEATRWYRLAADSGNESAKVRLTQLQESRRAAMTQSRSAEAPG